MNYHQVSKIVITPQLIDCIVFWTKNPKNILPKLDLLSAYNYYFQITINPYDNKIERYLPSKKEIINSFRTLSRTIGKEKTIWRYDPIILTKEIDTAYHALNFELIASKLEGYTDRCIISFLDLYQKSERNMKQIKLETIKNTKMLEIAAILSKIADKYHIKIETCSEYMDFSPVGIEQGKCIDDRLLSKIVGQPLSIKKDINQREICGCVTSIDIGAYNTCGHGCLYCYANYSDTAVKNNFLKHDPASPMLVGNIEPEDRITERKMVSYLNKQQVLNFCD